MKIKVYSTPTCPYCTMAKEYLKENDISFSDVDVSTDQNAAGEMVQKSGQMGVPVITIDLEHGDHNHEEVIVGFDQQRIAKLLDIK